MLPTRNSRTENEGCKIPKQMETKRKQEQLCLPQEKKSLSQKLEGREGGSGEPHYIMILGLIHQEKSIIKIHAHHIEVLSKQISKCQEPG